MTYDIVVTRTFRIEAEHASEARRKALRAVTPQRDRMPDGIEELSAARITVMDEGALDAIIG